VTNPTAAMLVIGDEILSGRTRDSNLHHLAGRLTEIGIDLKEARVVGDDHATIVSAVLALSEAHDYVFTSGGIGPTHDDITADAVADAFGAQIGIRADARAILQAHYERSGIEFNEARQRMARIPEGATLIENPISFAPGFRIGNVHVMAGVPKIFEAMVAAVLPGLATGKRVLSVSVRVDRPEGEIATALGRTAAAHPGLSFGSYPFFEGARYGTNIVIRGTEEATLEAAGDALRRALGL